MFAVAVHVKESLEEISQEHSHARMGSSSRGNSRYADDRYFDFSRSFSRYEDEDDDRCYFSQGRGWRDRR